MANKNSSKFQNFLLKNENYVSWGLGILAVLIVAILIVNYFQKTNQPAPEITEAQREEITAPTKTKDGEQKLSTILPTKHTVSSSESLWSIALKYYNSGYNWVDIASENKLANPDIIFAGNVLVIPQKEAKILPKTGIVESQKEAVANPKRSITNDNYTVQNGDSLWTIAEKAYGNGAEWTKIDQINKLGRLPNGTPLIHSGNILTIPR